MVFVYVGMIQVPPQTLIDIGRKLKRIQCLLYGCMLFCPSKVHIAWVIFVYVFPQHPTYHMVLPSVHKFLSMCVITHFVHSHSIFKKKFGDFFGCSIMFKFYQKPICALSLSLWKNIEIHILVKNNCKKTKNNNNIMKLDTCKLLKKKY